MIERFKDFYVKDGIDLETIKKLEKHTPFCWIDDPPGTCRYKDDKGEYVLFDDGKLPKCCSSQLYSAYIYHDEFKVEFRTSIFGRTWWRVDKDYWFNDHCCLRSISSPEPEGYELENLIYIFPMSSKEFNNGIKKINTSILSDYVINIIKSEMPKYGYDDDYFYYVDNHQKDCGTLSQALAYANDWQKKRMSLIK